MTAWQQLRTNLLADADPVMVEAHIACLDRQPGAHRPETLRAFAVEWPTRLTAGTAR
ncbi:hypothetical protein JVX90_00115 [Gordonia sp. PDNC005]|uniref:hypothetical protein n=1 Tax=Gordonia sp. PDNC005 TaxID=2811424 RepID=UPI0019667423|nr:hypothetical protein [Gordonia sp. PDNC005]QRY62717.1 hypothetical protein JVX90_00115 [Gordonia sp. PDNC005]